MTKEKGELEDPTIAEEKARLVAEEESKLKLQESEKEKLGKVGEEKPKVDDTDYKALFEAEKVEREKAEEARVQMQSGFTSKLQKLANYEKVEAAKATENDELTQIDNRIAEIDKQLPLYEQDKIDTTALASSKHALQLQKKRVIEDRHRDEAAKRIKGFASKHKGFKDYDRLEEIIDEAYKDGETLGLEGAFRIWDKEQEIAKIKESAAIDADSDKLGDKALGQDGKPLPKSPDKPDTTTKFYEDMFGKERAAKMLKTEQ